MKNFLAITLLLWSQIVFGQSEPITSLQGDQGTKFTSPKLVVPNLQATKTAKGGRIETGNKDVLENPSFEHTTFSTGWTFPTGTASATTEALNAGSVYSGNKALKIVSTGSGIRGYQSVTLNAAAMKGGQMTAKIMVNSSDPLLQVCANKDSVLAASDEGCQTVPVSTSATPWQTIEVPFIAGSTSNVIVFKSATTTVQNIYLDDAELYPGLPRVVKMGDAYQVGGLKYASATGCNWTTSSTTFTNYAVDTDCLTPTVTGEITAPATKVPGFTMNVKPGTYYVVANGFFYQNGTAGSAYFRFTDGVSTSQNQACYGANGCPVISGSFTFTEPGQKTIQIQGAAETGAQEASVYLIGANRDLSFSVYYFPPSNQTASAYLAQNGNTNWAPCTFSTLAWQGLGTVTNNLECARVGSELKMRGSITTGTVTGSEVQIPLPTNFGTIAGRTASIGYVGTGTYYVGQTTSPKGGAMFITSGLNTVVRLGDRNTFGASSSPAANPLTLITGTAIGSGVQVVFSNFEVSIESWINPAYSSLSFANMETCANAYECTNEFVANISSTGVVSNENVDWINGNCTVATASNYTCTYLTILKDGVNPLSSNMVCNILGIDVATEYINISATSNPTKAEFKTFNSAGSGLASSFMLKCSKGTNDYKPKTAKIASSIGVPTVPGIVGVSTGERVDTFSFSYGTTAANTVCSSNPCSYLDQIGTAVTQVGWSSAGVYPVLFSKTYTKIKCAGNAHALSSSSMWVQDIKGFNTNTVTITTNNAVQTPSNSTGTFMCQGQY